MATKRPRKTSKEDKKRLLHELFPELNDEELDRTEFVLHNYFEGGLADLHQYS